jgi:hypothetical protein
MTTRAFTLADQEWLQRETGLILEYYSQLFARETARFSSSRSLLQKYREAVAATEVSGWDSYPTIVAIHNELALAELLLRWTTPRLGAISYEPPLPNQASTIDFSAKGEDDTQFYIDAKTILPKMDDRWDQYEDIQRRGLLSEQTDIELRQGWLGGELWHQAFSARERFLEHTIALEKKVRVAGGLSGTTRVLVLFSTGFHWHLDELEDFVVFYHSGEHAQFDPFGRMEAFYISQKGIHLDRTIDQFAFLRRPLDALSVISGVWPVRPPRLPF